jgi:hypothetical protein
MGQFDMPRNPDGTSEIRALFASVDQLARSQDRLLVAAEGSQLTDRGRRIQRNYENWRRRKLVPAVLKNSPPNPIDAQYVDRFLDLTDGRWLPNIATVLHIFAEGVPCPPEVIRNATRTVWAPMKAAEEGDPDAVSLDKLAGAARDEIHDQARGNKKNWRESSGGKLARLLAEVLESGTAIPSDNEEFVDDEAKEAPLPVSGKAAIAQIISPLVGDALGREVEPSELDINAGMFDAFSYAPALKAFGINPDTITANNRSKTKRAMNEMTLLYPPAVARLRDDPESITARIKPFFEVFEMFSTAVNELGIKIDLDSPKVRATLDVVMIVLVAIEVEKENTK